MNEPTPAKQAAYGCGAGRDCGCISLDEAAEAERQLAEAAARAREALDDAGQVPVCAPLDVAKPRMTP